MSKKIGRGAESKAVLPEISISRLVSGDNGSTYCQVYITDCEGVARRTLTRSINGCVETWLGRYERVWRKSGGGFFIAPSLAVLPYSLARGTAEIPCATTLIAMVSTMME